MDLQLSNEVALRISMASKSLPELGTKSFLGLLIQHLGEPLSAQKLMSLSPKSFRILVSSVDKRVNNQAVNQALAVLTSQEITLQQPPKPSNKGPLSGAKLKVAVTSNQGETLDGHFGSCLRFLVYEVNALESQLVDVREIDGTQRGEKRTDANLALIKDCHMLFTLSIGGPAAAKVTRANIHPIKKTVETHVDTLLGDLSGVIRSNPPPWIQKLLLCES
ncbi:hypothetical protein ST37_01245 (plasmid) [Vibrio sp. qd031]|uniref:NifB/NifX family molybdenum-iron cluster-binding protein n=1 Tax=Vibrio sp. qd031 TaxID=1603038 RepID=UPI000A105D7E|nr:NifB/NifX family molybdenum-iron cluster-binding protein [Vibrio sp. qd031]ORT52444.1 hypothetical protein ST37_01245 [Vibrio sp. qd031]